MFFNSLVLKCNILNTKVISKIMPVKFESHRLIVITGKPGDEQVNHEIDRFLERRFQLRDIIKDGEDVFYYLTLPAEH